MNEITEIKNEICSKCYEAETYRDLGEPEEVFMHCYSQECSCGCFQKTNEAIQKMIEIYNKLISEKFQQKFK